MESVLRKLEPDESVVSAELDDEAVLLNVQTGIYYGLDGVGAAIWALLGQGHVGDAIVARLAAEYDADVDQLRTDVSEFLDLLIDKGLVRAVQA